jgi:hypothetical protein
VKFDRTNFTLTLDLKDCTRCYGRGKMPTKIKCRSCKGTGNGPRGGVRSCKNCYGSGNDYDQVNLSTCEKCDGSPHRAELENFCDAAPAEAVGALQLRVARQDRETSWNETHLGLNSLWSSADYGRAWDKTDIEVMSQVREDLLGRHSRVAATNLLATKYDSNATTLPIVRGLVIVVSRGGYSVRADNNGLAERIAERELPPGAAHVLGMAVYRAGGNGTMAAAMPMPECQEYSRAGQRQPKRPAIAHQCPECGQVWTVDDDPNEWAYGHDCEA